MTQYNIAVVGVTGAVGTRMLEQLEESTLPIETVRALASKRSAGKIVEFKGQELVVEELTEESFEGIDIALFSAGGSVSEKYAPYAVKAGAVVVDNTSFFRQNPNVPLVVPEVNAHTLEKHNGIIACPNCSTIQMMVALEPIRQAYGLERVIVISEYSQTSSAICACKSRPSPSFFPIWITLPGSKSIVVVLFPYLSWKSVDNE